MVSERILCIYVHSRDSFITPKYDEQYVASHLHLAKEHNVLRYNVSFMIYYLFCCKTKHSDRAIMKMIFGAEYNSSKCR